MRATFGAVIVAVVLGSGVAAPGAARAEPLTLGDIVTFFDDSVAAGTLVGAGSGSSAVKRRKALRSMLVSAGQLIETASIDDACDQLFDAVERTDVRFPPPDFVAGTATTELSDLILTLRIDLACDIQLLPAGQAGTFQGPGGTTVSVPAGAVPYEVSVGIGPARSGVVVANNGNLPIQAAVELFFQPTIFNASLGPPTAPLEITVPAPAGMAAGETFLVGQQVLSDFVEEGSAGLREQFVAVASGQEQNGQLVSTSAVFPGVFSGGVLVFLGATGSGYATGIVSDAGVPQAGAIVSSDTNTLVSVTDLSGRYNLFISGGPFVVDAFAPLRGSAGSAAGNIATEFETVTANIGLTSLIPPAITRDGIRNGGFEKGDVSLWATSGDAQARQQLVCTGATIEPAEGDWMGDVSTGEDAVGSVGSAIAQRFTVPRGVNTLRVDFNYVSEEFPEFVGSIFNDSFQARITTPNGESTFQQVTVNDSGGFQLIGDCGFPGGDDTAGMTGWRTASVDVSSWAGTGTPIQVDLLFSANDAGDDIFDTHVLLDNMRFSTLWIDVKLLRGPTIAANADAERVRKEVREANEILSQAGMNVRIRDIRTADTTDALLDTDITWDYDGACTDGRINGLLTDEEKAVLGLLRGPTNTDLNVYYVRSSTYNALGYTLSQDDFCMDVNTLTNSGTLQMDDGTHGNVLAHEIGHITIAPDSAGSSLEHTAPAGNFLSDTPLLGVVTREQSANINRAGAPLLRE